MLNVVILMGRLAKTPEVKKDKNGEEFTTACIAVDSGKEQAMYVDLVCYSASQKAFDFVDTGDQIGVSGRLDIQSYTKKDGSKGLGVRVIVNNVEFGAKKAITDNAPEVQEAEEATKAQETKETARPKRR